MAAVTGLTLIKRFTYRGDPLEEWSNTYHFNGAPPGDAASWKVLAGDLINLERHCYDATNTVVRAYGYDSDDPTAHSVWEYNYELQGEEVAGDFVIGADGTKGLGDQAALLWWQTDKKNSRGKWIYCRKYMHSVWISSVDPDKPAPSYVAALRVFGNALAPTGSGFHGGIRPQRYTVNIVTNDASGELTTRTLHRRGKRPLAHP